MSNMTIDTDGKGLVPFPETGKPKPRVRDMKSLHSVFLKFKQDDEKAAYNRSLVRDAADGAPPYPDADLESEGRFNLNFHDLSALMDERNSVYTDLIESVPNLARFHFADGFQEDAETERKQQVIAEEFTQLNRSDWPEFYSNWDLLVNEMAQHGVALAYAPDETTWKWEAAGLDDFLIPRRAKARESALDVVFIRGSFSVDALYRMVSDEKVAKGAGWDVNAARRAMVKATKGATAASQFLSYWVDVQDDLANNDLSGAYYKATEVSVVHALVKEYGSGAYSHYIMPEDGDGEGFLFVRPERYASDKDCFTIFTARIGRNGKYHSIRGDLYRAYPEAQALNRLRCAALDSTAHSMSVMLQPADSESMEDMAIVLNGPVTVLPPEATMITQRVQPNLQNNAIPMIADMTSTMRENLGMTRPANIDFANTQYGQQVQSMALGALTGSQVSRFYRSLKRVFEMQVNRIKAIGPNDGRFPEIQQFFARLAARGVLPEEFLYIERVEPYRAAGNGSVGHRLAAFTQGLQLVGSLDEVGRQRFLLGYFSELFGRDLALQFVGQPQGARYVIDRRIAELENATMRTDPELQPQPGENNFVHAQVHLGKAAQITAAVQEALNVPDADPNAVAGELNYAGTLLGHVEPHIAAMSEDPMREREFGELRQAFQQVVAQLQAMAKLIQQLTPTEGEQQEQSSRLQMQMQEHQLKMQMLQEAHQVKLSLRQAEVQQRLQLRQAQTQIKVATQLSQQAARG
jgi:hypothetical protein